MRQELAERIPSKRAKAGVFIQVSTDQLLHKLLVFRFSLCSRFLSLYVVSEWCWKDREFWQAEKSTCLHRKREKLRFHSQALKRGYLVMHGTLLMAPTASNTSSLKLRSRSPG